MIVRAATFSVLASLMLVGTANGASEIYSAPKIDEAQKLVFAWLDEQNASQEIKDQVKVLWVGLAESVPADQLLQVVVQSFAVSDIRVMQLMRECNSSRFTPVAPEGEFVRAMSHSSFFAANLQLYYGRCLVERRLYDEAWDVLKSVDARLVVDPAALFFFKAVAAQGMLELKPAMDAIDQLLTNTEQVPIRYSATAALMQADLKGLQQKSLGETARLMADSERRLELGRAGERVQGIQERIISNLDEIIKKVEQQRSNQNSNGEQNQNGGNNSESNPADESRVKGAESPGETDKKNYNNKGSWGNLPDKDLTKAKNDLNKNFPSHYERAIEMYTKKLAGRTAKKPK